MRKSTISQSAGNPLYFIVGCLLSLYLTGCSYRAAYESIQSGQKFQCEQLPAAQYQDCIERAQRSAGSYDDYQQEREAVQSQSH